MSDIIIAFILGIVEGLAEFLPISSTGHLILVGHLLDFEGERAKTFEIVIQLGAILAIAILYHKRLVSLCNIKPLIQKEKKFNAFHVFLGVFPAVVAGLLLHDIIKTYLFQPYTVVIGLVAGAILMIFAEVKKKEAAAYSLDDLTYRQALTIGLFQCLAVYPGFSRAGSTISGGACVARVTDPRRIQVKARRQCYINCQTLEVPRVSIHKGQDNLFKHASYEVARRQQSTRRQPHTKHRQI